MGILATNGLVTIEDIDSEVYTIDPNNFKVLRERYTNTNLLAGTFTYAMYTVPEDEIHLITSVVFLQIGSTTPQFSIIIEEGGTDVHLLSYPNPTTADIYTVPNDVFVFPNDVVSFHTLGHAAGSDVHITLHGAKYKIVG